MDSLYTKAKELFPNASDDEINQSIAKIRSEAPNASDDEIVQAAGAIKGQIDSGEFHKGMVRENIKQKYNMGQYSPEERQKLVDANAQAASPVAAAFAGFGAGLRGGDVGAGFKTAMDASQGKTKQALEAFDTGRKNRMADVEFGRSERDDAMAQDKLKREQDPNSIESKMAQDLAISMGMNPDQAKGLSAAKFKDFSTVMQKKYEIAEKAKDREESRADRNERFRDTQEDRKLRREELQSNKDLARQDKLDKETKLSDKQIEGVSSYDKALGSIKSIKSQKGDFDTGPLAGRLNSVAGALGMDDSKKTAFRSEVQDQLATYIKSISGGAVSDQERAALMQNIPSMNDNDETFNRKLDALEARLQRNRETELSNLKKGGKNTKEFETVSSNSGYPKTVKDANGRSATVSNAQEEKEAKAEGFN